MTVLPYEVPTHVEGHFLSRPMIRRLSVGAVAMGLLGVGLPILLHRLTGRWASVWTVIGPTLSAVAMVLCLAVHGQTQVFADRLEVSLRGAGLTVWRRPVPWPDVVRCDVARRRWGGGYKVWGRGPGLTEVMFGGDGVRLRLRDGGELAIGSDDPARLAAAIDAARGAPV